MFEHNCGCIRNDISKLKQPNLYNSFIPIPKWLHSFLVVYFVVYKVSIPIFNSLFFKSEVIPVFSLNLLDIVYSTLLYAPIIFRFKNIGLLHPLIFPLLFSFVKVTASNFGFNLISPFILDEYHLSRTLAFSLTDTRLIELNFQSKLFNIVALLSFYLGYFAVRNYKYFKIPSIPIQIFSSHFKYSIKVMTALIMGGLFLFLLSRGGVAAHISSWGMSRKEALKGVGPLIAIFNLTFILPLMWYIFKGAKLKGDIFLMIFILITVFVGFVLSGSRSSIINVIVSFIVVWMLQNRKIPTAGPIIFGIAFFYLFGLLGELRSTVYDKQVDWDVLTQSTLQEAADFSSDEIEKWNNLGSSIAIYHKVPEQEPFLNGKPYLAALFFIVPRLIWDHKPHGTGYYVGRRIYNRAEAGIPPGEVAEVYYNFGFLGIIIMFLLKGIIVKKMVNRIVRFDMKDDIYFLVFYLVFLFKFSLTVLSIVQLLQVLLFLIGLKSIIGKYDATECFHPWLSKKWNKYHVQSIGETLEDRRYQS